MANENKVIVKLVANLEQFNAQMAMATQAIKDNATNIVSSLGKVSQAIELSNQQNARLYSGMASSIKNYTDAAKTSSSNVVSAINQMSSQSVAAFGAMGAASQASSQQIISSLNQITSQLSAIRGASNSSSMALSQLNNTVGNLGNTVNITSVQFNDFSRTINNATSSIVSSLLSLSGIGSLVASVKELIQTESSLEQLEKSFRNIQGSIEAGDKSFAMVKKWAMDTPYSLTQTGDMFVRLKNYGIEPTVDVLNAFGNTAARTKDANQTLITISTQLGQAWAKNKLQGQDLKLIMEAGVPALDIMAKATGRTTDEIQNFATKGMLGRDAIKLLIDELGRLNEGAMDERMKSFDGQLQIFKDNILSTVDEIRKSGGLSSLTDSFKDVNEWMTQMKNSGAMKEFSLNFVAATSSMVTALKSLGSMGLSIIGGILNSVQYLTTLFTDSSKENVSSLEFWSGGFWFAGMKIRETIDNLITIWEHMASMVNIKAKDISLQFNEMKTVISVFSSTAGAILKDFSVLVYKSLTFDIKGAAEAYDKFSDDVVNGMKRGAAKIKAEQDKNANEFREYQNGIWRGLDNNSKERSKAFKMDYDPVFRAENTPYTPPPSPKNSPGIVDLPLKKGKDKREKGEASEYQLLMERLSANKLAHEKILEEKEKFYSQEKQIEDELAFLKKNQSSLKYESDRVKVQTKINEDMRKLGTMRLQAIVGDLRDEQSSYRNNLDEQIKIQDKIISHYVEGTEEYKKEIKKRLDLTNSLNDQNLRIAQEEYKGFASIELDKINDVKSSLKIQLTEHQINQKAYLALMLQTSRQELEIRQKLIEDEISLEKQKSGGADPAKIRQLMNQKLAVENQFNKATAKNAEEAAKATQKPFDDAFKHMSDSFASNIEKMAKKQQSFGQAVRYTLGSMVLYGAKIAEKMAFDWIKNETKKIIFGRTAEATQTGITKAGEATRLGIKSASVAAGIGIKAPELALHTGLETAKVGATVVGEQAQVAAKTVGASEGLLVKGAAAIAEIGMDAWRAMAGAYAAIAGIPYVGPILAPIAAATAFAGVAAIAGNIVSAEGGYRVPGNVSEMPAILHPDEKVLPAGEAKMNDEMYRMMKSGRGGGGNTYQTTNNWNFPNANVDSFRATKSQTERRQARSQKKMRLI